jgi:hypothetical protein
MTLEPQQLDGTEVRLQTYRWLLRHDGKIFQSAMIRKELGWSERSWEGHRMHAVLQELKDDGIITQSGPPRKRNQYLMVDGAKGRSELQRRFDALKAASTNGGPATSSALMPVGSSLDVVPKAAPKRVRYLEDRVAALESQSSTTLAPDPRIDEILAVLQDLSAKVNELHGEWIAEST